MIRFIQFFFNQLALRSSSGTPAKKAHLSDEEESDDEPQKKSPPSTASSSTASTTKRRRRGVAFAEGVKAHDGSSNKPLKRKRKGKGPSSSSGGSGGGTVCHVHISMLLVVGWTSGGGSTCSRDEDDAASSVTCGAGIIIAVTAGAHVIELERGTGSNSGFDCPMANFQLLMQLCPWCAFLNPVWMMHFCISLKSLGSQCHWAFSGP